MVGWIAKLVFISNKFSNPNQVILLLLRNLAVACHLTASYRLTLVLQVKSQMFSNLHQILLFAFSNLPSFIVALFRQFQS